MNKALLFFVALWALVALSSARPLMFFADQTDAPFGLTNGWSGIATAWTTLAKGQNNHRVRFYGVNRVNETLTDAWINYANGTIIEHLAVTTNSSLRYFLGDYRMNATVWDLLTHEELYVTVASTNHKSGAITGYFRCRPYQGVSVLTAGQVVGASSTSAAVGLGWASLDVSTIFALPQDILAQDTSIEANTRFNGRVLHGDTGATAVTFNGPANTSETATALATATLYGVTLDGKFTNVTVDADYYSIASGNTYFQVSGTSGIIRGQIYPLLSPTRRAIPYGADTVNGATVLPIGGFSTLRYANQQGAERNPNSFVSLVSTANPTNFTYLGVFYLKSATNKRNFDLVRALTLEMNAKISGTGTWLFEVFDSTTGEFLPVGTLTTADDWTPAYVESWSFDTSDYANTRHQLVVRVSVNSAVQSTLYLDLFGVRSWIPSSLSNQVLKVSVKLANESEGKFANGTIING
jgi:hypothetical protein